MQRLRDNFVKLKAKVIDTHALVEAHLALTATHDQIEHDNKTLQKKNLALQNRVDLADQQTKLLQDERDDADRRALNAEAEAKRLKQQLADLEAVLRLERTARGEAEARQAAEAVSRRRLGENAKKKSEESLALETRLQSIRQRELALGDTLARLDASEKRVAELEQRETKRRRLAAPPAAAAGGAGSSTPSLELLWASEVEAPHARLLSKQWARLVSAVDASQLLGLLAGPFARDVGEGGLERVAVGLPRHAQRALDALASEIAEGLSAGWCSRAWVHEALLSIAARLVQDGRRAHAGVLLCSAFALICRVLNDSERLRVLAVEMARYRGVAEPVLLAAMISAWPDPFVAPSSCPLLRATWWAYSHACAGAGLIEMLAVANCDEDAKAMAEAAMEEERIVDDALRQLGDASLSAESFSASIALELIASVKGWGWTFDTLIRARLFGLVTTTSGGAIPGFAHKRATERRLAALRLLGRLILFSPKHDASLAQLQEELAQQRRNFGPMSCQVLEQAFGRAHEEIGLHRAQLPAPL